MNIPDWLTKEFLEDLIKENQKHPSTKIHIIEHDIVSALPKGNNYLSNILRIHIKYDDNSSGSVKKKSLIAKVPLQTGELSKLNEAGVIAKEFNAYSELLPKLNKIAQLYEKHVDFIPKMYKNNVQYTMILEDLIAQGYKMGNRKEQLDYEHAVVVLKNLARFHAASVKLHESEPKLVEKLGEDRLFCKNLDDGVRNVLDPLMGESHMDLVCEEFSKWPETRKFVEFLQKLKPKIWDLYGETLYADDNEFTVLNHGDCWTNNMLFKYDENGKPISLKFVDFQILRYSSPTTDLLYFLHTSVPFDVLDKHFDNFTEFYLDNLNLYLEKYGTSKYLNEEDFKESLAKREIFSMLQCINILPFMFAEYTTDEEKSTEEIGVPAARLLQSEKYRSVCAKYLEKFSKTAWFQNFE